MKSLDQNDKFSSLYKQLRLHIHGNHQFPLLVSLRNCMDPFELISAFHRPKLLLDYPHGKRKISSKLAHSVLGISHNLLSILRLQVAIGRDEKNPDLVNNIILIITII